MSNKDNTSTSLSTMLGSGDFFEAKGKKYTVSPMPLAHIESFVADSLNISGAQIFNMADKKSRGRVDKWLGEVSVEIAGKPISTRYCVDENGEVMSLEKAMADGWDIEDLKNYFKKMCGLSG